MATNLFYWKVGDARKSLIWQHDPDDTDIYIIDFVDWIGYRAQLPGFAVTSGNQPTFTASVGTAPTVSIGSGGVGTVQVTNIVDTIVVDGQSGTFTGNVSATITRHSGDTTGFGATAVVNMNTNGTVASISIVNPGQSYTAAPDITVTGAGGTCTAHTTITGIVTGVTVTTPGTYALPPIVTISAPAGGGVQATALCYLNNLGGIASVQVINPGTKYTSPTVAFAANLVANDGLVNTNLQPRMGIILSGGADGGGGLSGISAPANGGATIKMAFNNGEGKSIFPTVYTRQL